MRVIFCLGSMTKGGAERVVANLSNWLCRDNEVGIIVTPPDESSYTLDEKIKYMTLDFYKEKKQNILLRNFKRVRRLKNYIKEFNPDIVLTFLPEPSYRILFLKPFIKKKVIVSVRNDPKIEYKKWYNKLIMKMLYKKADGFVFQTEEAKEFFSKTIQNKSVVIPNPINPIFISTPYTGERDKTIVTVGRLEEQKNQKLLINAFSKIENSIPEYKLLIYGIGSMEKELKNYVYKTGIDKKILFKGQKEDIKKEIYKSGLFVLSSDYEGMPNALMEAMALGLPCVSTDCPCGGPRFLIKNDENGILVPVNDEEKMAEAILRVINNKEFANKLSSEATKIKELVNPQKINNDWLDYIKKIISK